MHFRKQDDLRLISHRDLVRAFERLFRRCDLPLRMSEGFHPKAKMSFPLALSLGIASDGEVMEFELTEPIDASQLRRELGLQAPRGLEITELRMLQDGEGKAQVRAAVYQFPIPAARREQVREKLTQFSRQDSFLIQRDGAKRQIDLKAGSDHLEFCDGNLEFRLPVNRAGSVRPREVLEALGVADLENEGCYLTRTGVEIAP
jgi:radical SAM-linked protein